jgi:hypothetical protein
LFPSEKIHVGVRDSDISILPLPECSEKKENGESDVSPAKGVKSREEKKRIDA